MEVIAEFGDDHDDTAYLESQENDDDCQPQSQERGEQPPRSNEGQQDMHPRLQERAASFARLVTAMNAEDQRQEEERLHRREIKRRQRLLAARKRAVSLSEHPELHRHARDFVKVDLETNPFCFERQLEDATQIRTYSERKRLELVELSSQQHKEQKRLQKWKKERQLPSSDILSPPSFSALSLSASVSIKKENGSPTKARTVNSAFSAAAVPVNNPKTFGHRPKSAHRHFNPLTMTAEHIAYQNTNRQSRPRASSDKGKLMKHKSKSTPKKIGLPLDELQQLLASVTSPASSVNSQERTEEDDRSRDAQKKYSNGDNDASDKKAAMIAKREKDFVLAPFHPSKNRILSTLRQPDFSLSTKERLQQFNKKAAGIVESFPESTSDVRATQSPSPPRRRPESPQSSVEREEIRMLLKKEQDRQKKLKQQIEEHKRTLVEQRYGVRWVSRETLTRRLEEEKKERVEMQKEKQRLKEERLREEKGKIHETESNCDEEDGELAIGIDKEGLTEEESELQSELEIVQPTRQVPAEIPPIAKENTSCPQPFEEDSHLNEEEPDGFMDGHVDVSKEEAAQTLSSCKTQQDPLADQLAEEQTSSISATHPAKTQNGAYYADSQVQPGSVVEIETVSSHELARAESSRMARNTVIVSLHSALERLSSSDSDKRKEAKSTDFFVKSEIIIQSPLELVRAESSKMARNTVTVGLTSTLERLSSQESNKSTQREKFIASEEDGTSEKDITKLSVSSPPEIEKVAAGQITSAAVKRNLTRASSPALQSNATNLKETELSPAIRTASPPPYPTRRPSSPLKLNDKPNQVALPLLASSSSSSAVALSAKRKGGSLAL